MAMAPMTAGQEPGSQGRGRAQAFLMCAFILFWLMPAAAWAKPCHSRAFEGASYIVCSFDTRRDRLAIYWRDGDGKPYRTFAALSRDLPDGETLRFAMNGGMYKSDFRPVGLYIENGRELAAADRATVSGPSREIPNFYKKPNGVFYLGADRAGILETDRFLADRPQASFATQSGPLLVIDGALHPLFIANSTDRKLRNGVGLSSPNEVHFVITERPVNFHDFARFFRDTLRCRNALFLDGGSASGIYAPELGRSDAPGHGGYGPIIAVVE
jgi:uncharacterized protein YigE (DUF2233 family)